jgi:hypothetical protein
MAATAASTMIAGTITCMPLSVIEHPKKRQHDRHRPERSDR